MAKYHNLVTVGFCQVSMASRRALIADQWNENAVLNGHVWNQQFLDHNIFCFREVYSSSVLLRLIPNKWSYYIPNKLSYVVHFFIISQLWPNFLTQATVMVYIHNSKIKFPKISTHLKDQKWLSYYFVYTECLFIGCSI